jgi:hypothetical protein
MASPIIDHVAWLGKGRLGPDASHQSAEELTDSVMRHAKNCAALVRLYRQIRVSKLEGKMRDIAKEAYQQVSVGATGWMRPDPSKGETVEGFQSVAAGADLMQKEGLISIRSKHRESGSGGTLIDAIQFTRLK